MTQLDLYPNIMGRVGRDKVREVVVVYGQGPHADGIVVLRSMCVGMNCM